MLKFNGYYKNLVDKLCLVYIITFPAYTQNLLKVSKISYTKLLLAFYSLFLNQLLNNHSYQILSVIFNLDTSSTRLIKTTI